MWTFLSTIACTVAIYWLFRGFGRWRIHTSWAITINYFVAAALGWSMSGGLPSMAQAASTPWLPVVIVMGLCFYPLFRLTAHCTQTLGVTVASIATKLSMAIPIVMFSLADGWHHAHWGQWLGVFLAFPAVILASLSQPSSEKETPNSKRWWKALHWMPLVMFAGSGSIDTVFGWFSGHETLVSSDMKFVFSAIPFTLGAFVGGLDLKRTKAPMIAWRDVVGGVVLGTVNFGSLFFLLLAYDANLMGRAMVVPTLNLSVILLATLGGLWMFGDPLDKAARWGVGLSALAIGLMMLFA